MKPKSKNRLFNGLQFGINFAGIGCVMLAGGLAQAGNLYWDTNYDTPGSGNSGGNWSAPVWTADAAGATATNLWVNGESAVFSAGTDGTGAWTVTLGAALTVSTPSITFAQTGSKTITGGTINIGGGTINATAVGVPGGDDININSVLAGAGGLTIAANGDGTSPTGGGGGAELRLGSNNTFSGGLKITKGVVTWNTEAGLGDPSNVITLDGGALLIQGAQSTPRDIKIGAAGGYYRGYGNSAGTFTGTISNGTGVASATLTRTDGGTMYLAGPGTSFTGTLVAAGGDFNLYSANADWSNAAVTLNNGRLIAGSGGTAKVKSLNTNKDVVIDNGTTLNVVSGAITMGGAHWYKTDNGSVGKLTSSSGTLNITNGAATGDLTTNDNQFRVALTDSGATPVAVVKNNNNSLVLTMVNSYTGGTTINGGRIQVEVAGGFGTGNVNVASGGQAWPNAGGTYVNNFTLNGNGPGEGGNAYGALRFGKGVNVTGNVTVASAARVTTNDANAVATISGSLIGSAALEKTGAGLVAINGSATGYTGTLTVAAGPLRLGSPLGSAGTGSVIVNDLAGISGKGSVANSLTLGTVAGATLSVDGQTAGALSTKDLTVNGLNTVKLTGSPLTPGTPMPILTYSGALTMTGVVTDHFQLDNAAAYRTPPVFANPAGAITLNVAAGANLVWRGEDPTNPTWWDTNVTANWKNGAVNPDTFYAGDNVLFDDTGVDYTVELQGLVAPASVTFNNSAGFDYVFPVGPGAGFTGGTGIVKNGTGTVLLGGYAHNYTGKVVINDGVLKANGNYELLGNSSGITVNDSVNGGGQLDINGANLGSNNRIFTFTIAGDGPDGLGAITNSGGAGPGNNSGVQTLILSADAAIGGNGGRFDVAYGGSISSGGFTLTKVGSGYVNVRGPALGSTYVIEGGMLGFENNALAAGTNPIQVNGGAVGAYGVLTFGNTLNMAADTAIVSNGGGTQTWNGPVNLTGISGDTVYLQPNGNILLDTVVSGDSNLNINAGGGQVIMAGAASNTYTGSTSISNTGQLILSKTGGKTAIPLDFYMSTGGTRAIVSATQDNQFGPTSAMFWNSTGDARLELKGTTQTLAGIDNTGASGGYNCIQHSEFGARPAVDGVSDLVLNVDDGQIFIYGGVIRDQGGKVNLTKAGLGTQSLRGTLIDYTGPTTITGGRLTLDSDDLHSVSVAVSAGAFYELNISDVNNRLEQDAAGFTLTGAGTFVKSGPGMVSMGWSGGASVAMAAGALIDIQGGTLQMEYGNLTTWTNNKSDLIVGASGVFDLWDNNNDGVFVDSLDGDGAIIRTKDAVGTLTIGVDNGGGDYFGSISSATGTTNLVKQGTGTQIFEGSISHRGNTTINGGTIEFTDISDLTFFLTDAGSNQINGTGTLKLDGLLVIDSSALTATSGSWTLIKKSDLASVVYGPNFLPGIGWTKTGTIWTGSEGSKTYTFNETTGVLALTSGSSYASWIDGFFPGVTDPAIVGPNADPDNDSIPNSVELVIGGNPKDVMNTALLPTLELVSNPVGVPAGNYFLFTFRRTDLSTASGVASNAQYNTGLAAAWTSAQDGVDGVVVLVDDNYGSFVPPATADTDRVRVFIPRGTNAKLFGRLKALVP